MQFSQEYAQIAARFDHVQYMMQTDPGRFFAAMYVSNGVCTHGRVVCVHAKHARYDIATRYTEDPLRLVDHGAHAKAFFLNVFYPCACLCAECRVQQSVEPAVVLTHSAPSADEPTSSPHADATTKKGKRAIKAK